MRFRSVVMASSLTLGLIGGAAPGPFVPSASAASVGISISGADITMILDASPNSYGRYESSGVTKTVTWHLCDTATSFTSTRPDDSTPAPGPIDPITEELTTNGCVEVPDAVLDLGSGAKISQFYADDATLFKKPTKPYLTFTVQWSDSSLFLYDVDAVADASRLRTLTSFPSLTKDATGFSAVDATWGDSPGNLRQPLSEYWMCDVSIVAGAGLLDFETGADPTGFTGAIDGCRPLYTSFTWEPEAEEFFPSRTTATTLAANAVLYTDPPATQNGPLVPANLTGKHIVRVSIGHPYITWTGSQPWGTPEPPSPPGSAQTVTWTPPASYHDIDSPVELPTASSSGNGFITYTVEDPGTAGCALGGANGRGLRFSSAGTCRVAATAAATANFLAGSASVTIAVNAARVPSQVIHLRPASIDHDTGDVTLVWKPPADTGTHPITQYRLRMRERGDGGLQRVGSTGPDDRQFTIEDLDPGSYYVEVWAVNAAGRGRGFVVGRVRVTEPDPVRAPAPVQDLRAVSVDAETGTVVWGWSSPPDTGKGPITRYRIRLRESGDAKYRTIDTVGGDITRVAMDLEPGSYSLRVRAGNAIRFGHAVMIGPVHIAG